MTEALDAVLDELRTRELPADLGLLEISWAARYERADLDLSKGISWTADPVDPLPDSAPKIAVFTLWARVSDLPKKGQLGLCAKLSPSLTDDARLAADEIVKLMAESARVVIRDARAEAA